MNVCAKCATSKEFVAIVLRGGKGLFEGVCDICKDNDGPVFKRS